MNNNVKNKLAYVFFDIPMYYGHGLRKILKNELKNGEFTIFINKNWNALKMLTYNNVLLHLKQPYHRPINPETIKFLPYCVNGSEINYKRALKSVIIKDFQKKGLRIPSPQDRR